MEIYIYGLILTAFIALAFLSRNEEGENVWDRMAGMPERLTRQLGRKFWRGPLAGENTVRADLAVLYPSGKLKGQEERFGRDRMKKALLIILAGDLLAIASYAASGQSLRLTDGYNLRREAVGEGEAEVELELLTPAADSSAGGEEGQKEAETVRGEYQVTVRARTMKRQEVDALARSLLDSLPDMILGENTDLKHVSGDLILPAQVEGFPFRIVWESSSYAAVDADGIVGNGGMAGEEVREVTLTPILTYDAGAAGEYRYEGEIPLEVIPPTRSPEEMFRQELGEAIARADEESAAETQFPLPQKVGDVPLNWREKPQDTGIAILAAAVIIAVLFYFAMESRLHDRVKQRGREMAMDYPSVVSKFALYLGAGLSVRNVFFKLGEDYLKQREEGEKERGAYEEIVLVTRELQGGIPEQEAYDHFRQRCRSAQYTRLCTLLTQNLKLGSRELLAALQEESEAALEERRDSARKIGEEAETKLLFPMILMLAVTMVIIIVPAYYSFSV